MPKGEFANGTLDGSVLITQSVGKSPYAEGHLSLRDATIVLSNAECTVNLPEVTLDLFPQQVNQKIQSSGLLEITKEGSLVVTKLGQPYWSLDTLKGSVSFKGSERTIFKLNAICTSPAQKRDLNITGEARFAKPGQERISVAINLQGSERNNDVIVNFSARELGEEWRFGELELSGFGCDEFAFVQHLIGNTYPAVKNMQAFSGAVDLDMLVYLRGLNISEINIEHLAARHFEFGFDSWGLVAKGEDVSGRLSFDLSTPTPLETLNADLNINQGRLSLAGLDRTGFDFGEVFTDLKIRQGIVHKSVLKGEVAGFKGEIEIDGTPENPVVAFNFGGQAKDFTKALPEFIGREIDQNLGNDHIKLLATATKCQNSVLFNGKLLIEDFDRTDDEIAFRFALEKTAERGQWRQLIPEPLLEEYCTESNLKAMQAFVPGLSSHGDLSQDTPLEHAFNFAGFALKEGWFEGFHLRFEKYLSPFLFENNELQLSGLGDIKGTFDQHAVAIQYEVHEMVLKNDFLEASINSYPKEEHQKQQWSGSYHFDFDRMAGKGKLPICGGAYLEKNSGLLFTDINAEALFDDNKIHFNSLEAFCNGIYFAGAIDVDWGVAGDGCFDVDIHAQQMHGMISQIQHFFSYVNTPLLANLPMEGTVDFHHQGGNFQFSFQPGTYELKAYAEGVISDARVTYQMADVILQEVGMNFEYDYQANTLNFSEIQGTLLAGPPKHMEEYSVSGDWLKFTDYAKNETEFDLWVGDKKRDIIRIAGKTRLLHDASGNGLIDFEFDPKLSHFGDVYPSAFKLLLKDWTQVEDFHLEFDFHLKTVLADLQRFSRSGLLFLSRSLNKELNAIKQAEGHFKAIFGYEGNRSIFTYDIKGADVVVADHQFNNFVLTGNKKGSIWTIDQLQFDDISLAVDLFRDEHLWNVNFLGARLGKSLLLGLEGDFNSETALLDAKVNLLEMDIAALNEWTALRSIIEGFGLAGKLQATGKVHVAFDKSLPRGMHIALDVQGALRNGKLRGLDLHDVDDMSISYISDRGLVINDIKTSLKSARDGTLQADLSLQKLKCDFINRELFFDGLAFKMPVANLPWLAENLQQSFPLAISVPVAEMITTAKKQGEIAGKLNLAISEPHCALQLTLQDDIYQLQGHQLPLQGFVLDLDPFNLKINTKCVHQKQLMGVELRSFSPHYDAGELVVVDLQKKASATTDHTPLIMHWEIDPYNGFFVKKIEGVLHGLTFNLIRDTNRSLAVDNLFLVGRVDVDLNKAHTFVDDAVAAKINSWELGKGYALQGEWICSKKPSDSFLESLAFTGELLGSDFEMLGYHFARMTAQLTHASDTATIKNLLISDPCGVMQVDQLVCNKGQDGNWATASPMVMVREFRPHLLQPVKVIVPRENSALVINSIEIQDFKGILGERESFRGNGLLTFSNPPKKNLHHPIFAIPADILTRIGLDLDVLTPVKGTLEYEIQQGKVAFTQFKDVYSKKRASKFYLADNNYPSYVDFDGNLHLQVRMKQYNLIFKLAELVTVTVQGTLKKPTYSLQKQNREE